MQHTGLKRKKLKPCVIVQREIYPQEHTFCSMLEEIMNSGIRNSVLYHWLEIFKSQTLRSWMERGSSRETLPEHRSQDLAAGWAASEPRSVRSQQQPRVVGATVPGVTAVLQHRCVCAGWNLRAANHSWTQRKEKIIEQRCSRPKG